MSVQAGMTEVEVVGILGSPQMVTRGPGGRQVWIWDGVSSEGVETSGAATGVLAGAGAGSAATVSIAVRFEADQRVGSVAVHAVTFDRAA